MLINLFICYLLINNYYSPYFITKLCRFSFPLLIISFARRSFQSIHKDKINYQINIDNWERKSTTVDDYYYEDGHLCLYTKCLLNRINVARYKIIINKREKALFAS